MGLNVIWSPEQFWTTNWPVVGGFAKLITPEILKRVVFPTHDDGVAEILLIEHGFIIEQSVVAEPTFERLISHGTLS